jgi:hypothetical protein
MYLVQSFCEGTGCQRQWFVVFRMYRDVFWLLRISWTHQACVMPATPHPSEND